MEDNLLTLEQKNGRSVRQNGRSVRQNGRSVRQKWTIGSPKMDDRFSALEHTLIVALNK